MNLRERRLSALSTIVSCHFPLFIAPLTLSLVGQTPRKLFNSPHPDRMMHGVSSLPLGTIYGIPEDYHLLTQGTKLIRDLGNSNAVRELVIDMISERIIPCGERTLAVPSHPHEVIEWDAVHAPAGELRVLVDRKVVQVIEAALCSCVAFADADTLVSGSTDYTVRLWKLVRGQTAAPRPLGVIPTHIMRAHTAPVTCVVASRPWSIVVSGSQDGSAALWDLNRGVYVRSIWHGQGKEHGVHLVAIQDSSVRPVFTFSASEMMNFFIGLHRDLLARETMVAHRKRKANRGSRSYGRSNVPHLSSDYGFSIP